MQAIEELPPSGTSALQHPAIRKLQRLAHLLRVASAAYVAWAVWNVMNWWLDADKVKHYFGEYIHRDLSALTASQRYAALAIDWMALTLLLMAVVHCWRFLKDLDQPARWNGSAARHIARCAWFAVATEVLTLLSRPVKSFLLTLHLPEADQLWKWNFQNMDLLAVLFCLSLLMFAYVFTWTMEVAEENRSFV